MLRWLLLGSIVGSSVGCMDDTAVDDPDTDDTELDEPDDTPPLPELGRRVTVQRGVDRAGQFSVHEARILDHDHGVKWTGVYIGGACNGGFGWTKAGVEAIHHATGWRFMPIWVGQQSPSICGAHSLTYTRGKLDGAAAAHRMHAFGWGAHKDIPIALDVEGGTYEFSPHRSTAYVHGWIHAVHAAGYRAYVYSSPFGIKHFHDAKLKLDGAWVASWHFNGFHAVRPSGLHEIGNRYTRHNRAWQYSGDFPVSGVGGVDANTSDLLLAPAPGGTNIATVAPRDVADDEDELEDAVDDGGVLDD